MMRSIALALVATFLLAGVAPAQMEDVQIETIDVTDGVHMLRGRGGNLAVSTGLDGVFLVDDQYAPLSEKILAAIAAIDDRPLRFVLNTHWHGDHTGGNENMGRAGAYVVSHDNVRARMAIENFSEFLQRTTPPAVDAALPVVTFNDAMTFHFNGDEIHVFHVPHAHTDGDAVVHFRRSNVVHTGDVVFFGLYPFIDVDSGGSVDGVIAATTAILDLCDDSTKIIPGHGPLLGVDELRAYRDLLVDMRAKIVALMDEGLDVEAAKQRQPFAEYDADWGQVWLSSDQMVEVFYRSLAASE